jgi:diketogulonate reductase-like aldo/keto reductase
VYEIAARLHASPDQVLLAWARAKGAVLVTYVLYASIRVHPYFALSDDAG